MDAVRSQGQVCCFALDLLGRPFCLPCFYLSLLLCCVYYLSGHLALSQLGRGQLTRAAFVLDGTEEVSQTSIILLYGEMKL
jgi:hypothetical protein